MAEWETYRRRTPESPVVSISMGGVNLSKGARATLGDPVAVELQWLIDQDGALLVRVLAHVNPDAPEAHRLRGTGMVSAVGFSRLLREKGLDLGPDRSRRWPASVDVEKTSAKTHRTFLEIDLSTEPLPTIR